MHKKIIEKALAGLDPERASYFNVVVGKLERDRRCEDYGNLVFAVLKDVMAELPVYLEHGELADQLLEFTETHYQQLRNVLYDPRFLHDPSSLRKVSGAFVHRVVALSLDKHENGEFEESQRVVHSYTWPYRETDIVDPDDDPEAWADAVARDDRWKLENSGVDRRKSRSPRIDEVAAGKHNKPKLTDI